MRLSLFLQLAFLTTAIAGNFNVANLAHEEALTIVVECDKRTQPFTLPAGADSGPFALPEKEAVFRVKDQEIATHKAAAGKAGRLVLLYRKNNQLTWHSVISKAEKDKTSLRLLNLTEGVVKLTMDDQTIELSAGQDLESVPTSSETISVTLDGQKKQIAKAEEPTPFIGIIYPTAQGPRLRLIADR
jgi:hypothetical protein